MHEPLNVQLVEGRRRLPIFRFDKILGIARGVKTFPGLKSERHAAEEQRKRLESRKRGRKAQREIVNQEVDYLSDKQRDPPPERIETAHLRQLPDFVIITLPLPYRTPGCRPSFPEGSSLLRPLLQERHRLVPSALPGAR
jgi:hypothetical protein